ncbi:MAG: 50S ribosomal protein L9 [Candidatus Marinimicrobia bacterium]|nr:50S ribosomal protein L9 [Candidatus Neomarinimicrobiota bacterium]|tara:strand:+ start:636 stop:1085 length:450 start_codon:yes stop_codon:yes gene_type:complete
MKIILKESVETLGEAGDIITVKPGYGRNYLIPQGLGVLATKSSIQATENELEAKAMKEAKTQKELQLVADKLNSIKLSFSLKSGEDDKLFGSVTTQMISSELDSKGFSVDKKYISLEEPIKTLGNYFAKVDFGSGIEARIKLKVISEEK